MNIPYNMNYTFDDDSLREHPESRDEMLKGIQYLKDKLTIGENILNQAKLLGNIGTYLRIVDHLQEAEHYLVKAIKCYQQVNDQLGLFVNQLRLSHVYHWNKDYEKANQMFNELVIMVENDTKYINYKDFVYQHYGKCLFDQRQLDEALKYFLKALSIREDKNDDLLIQSTEKAIEKCNEKMRIKR
ncbi:tetratricopeptide repeat protein [Chengkuizengella sediminis]|uniref:tetratricopeptide repeat protein n=1 Tax=Chengkuizengella sediminis TaxID=1885917 RepID=UPI001389A610|nr:tetratricopeptide repeat protein [Chengkuizengella sediminis]NDI35073.1 tetratricopeptide repeat protein [Chengkuizengella sediminis]